MKKLLFIFLFSTFYLLFSITPAASASDSLYFLHTDHLNSTVLITDKDGNRVWEGRYLPYGNFQFSMTNFQLPSSRLYTDQEKDNETGLYYYKARYYNPTTGRFVSADKAGSGLNKYSYAANNPIRFLDNGNDPVDAISYLSARLGGDTARVALGVAQQMYSGITIGEINIKSASTRTLSSGQIEAITNSGFTSSMFGGWWEIQPGVRDMQALNRAKLGRSNIALALAIAGWESGGFGSFANAGKSVEERIKGVSIQAHIGEQFMTAERIALSGIPLYSGKREPGGKWDEYLQQRVLNMFSRPIPKSGMGIYHIRQSELELLVWPVYTNQARQYEAMIYAYRMIYGDSGSVGQFDLIDPSGNINWNIVGGFFSRDPNSQLRQKWIEGVGYYYDIFRQFSEAYPEYNFLMQDTRTMQNENKNKGLE